MLAIVSACSYVCSYLSCMVCVKECRILRDGLTTRRRSTIRITVDYIATVSRLDAHAILFMPSTKLHAYLITNTKFLTMAWISAGQYFNILEILQYFI